MQPRPAKTQGLESVRWDDVRVFLAVQRSGSLGQAALRLGVDTSTVSRRLSALEEALGVRLFERARDGIEPTRMAELVLPACEAMEASQAELVRAAASAETAIEGVVRVSMAPGLADALIAPRLVRLRQRHPGLRIELDASARVLDLTRHEADLALRSVKPQGADLVALKLVTTTWVLAAAPGHARALGRVDDLRALAWIAWDRDFTSFGPSRWLARHVPRADVVLRTSHVAAQLAAARSGLGVVLAPEPYLAVHGLVPLQVARGLQGAVSALPRDDLWLVGHRVLRELPRVAAVWDFLRDELRPAGRSREPPRKVSRDGSPR